MDTILTVLGMLLTVVAILALAYVFTKYFARWKMGSLKAPRRGGRMLVLDQLPISGDARLLVVQVGARYLLLGHSADGLRTLCELTAEEAQLWQDESDGQSPGDDSGSFPSFRASLVDAWKQKRK